MGRTALATAWLLWRRLRWGALLLLAFGSGLALYTHAALPGPATTRLAIFLISLPLMFGLLYLMAAFAYPEADIMAPHSGFPRHMLVLPARTWELVFWPMLLGTVVVALAWTALFRLILIPAGLSSSIGWQASLYAALLACLQALSWSPMGLPYLRLVLALLLFPALVAAGVVGSVNGVSPALLTLGYLCVIVPAYGAAVVGLTRARRGDSSPWALRTPHSSRRTTGAPFASAGRAQFWLEWRRNGIVLPLMVSGMCFFLTVPLLWMRDLTPLEAGGVLPLPHLRELELNLWVKLLQGCVFWPILLAAIVGCGLKRSESRRGDLSLPPFLATRPLGSAALLLAKLQMAALSTLAAWVVLLFFLFLWLLTPARHGDRSGPLLLLLLPHVTPRTGLLFLSTLLVLVLWTWKNQVQGLCIDLTGRRWIVYGVPTAMVGAALTALVLFVQRSSGYPEMDAHYFLVPWYTPWLTGLAVTSKLTAGAMAMGALRRRRVVESRVLLGLVAGWLLVALALFGWLCWIDRAGLFACLGLPPRLHSPLYLAAAALLFLPFTRLALAPLSLEWNRHR